MVAGERAQLSSWDSFSLAPLTHARFAGLLLLFNLLDALFTLSFLQMHVAVEANPLMRAAYEHSPWLFVLVKLTVVHGGVFMLWRSRSSAFARAALQAGTVLYGFIVAYHVIFLVRLLLD